jgi:thiol:disulfide interchange protein DsbD
MRLLLVLLLLLPGLAHAQTDARLAPTTDGRAALVFTLAPGWHIYGNPPGDSGFPPRVTADPPGVAGPLTFPPAESLVQNGLHLNVLSGTVVLPFPLTGTQAITATWLECADVCVPHRAHLALAGPAVGATTATPPYWLLALLGGLVLNLMPCVFPILAMKAFAFARLSGAAHGHIRREALGYALGVMSSMLALAALLLILRTFSTQVFWGFQFHAPVFLLLAAAVMLAAALNMAGLFELPVPGFVQHIPAQHSFLTGLLAVLVATPCTAPFMGTAIAAALTLPAPDSLSIFAALGLGLALPILVLAFFPGLAAALPRPGAWMRWMQRALSLPLFATSGWLAWVFVLPLTHAAPLTLPGASPYTPAALAQARAAGQPVFVDLTAAWCVTCLINEHTTLDSPQVQAAFAAHHVAVLVGDWTQNSPDITALLTVNDRAGVPLYLYYAPGAAAPVTLPQVLTPGAVTAALGR